MKPILFSTEMVKAILDGRKTMTRRIVKPQPKDHNHFDYIEADWKEKSPEYVKDNLENEWYCKYCGDGIGWDGHSIYKPKYQIGDILWVRETWSKGHFVDEDGKVVYEGFVYKAGGGFDDFEPNYELSEFRWKSSRFMPRKAARIFLEVTNVRVEKLWDIKDENIINEGISIKDTDPKTLLYKEFAILWESIHGKDSWQLNPWIWVYEFKRQEEKK